MLIDRTGLTRGISLAVGLWSCAGIATGFTTGLGGLIGCRAVLGVAEAGGIPSAGKAIHTYLRPPERALGNAINQAGVMLGAILAPPVATWIAVRYGWRMAFVLTGILGLLWCPVWNRVARHAAPSAKPSLGAGHGELLRDRRLWAFVAANGLGMVGYSLWSNWTTQYLVDVHRLTVAQAAWYAWIPPLVGISVSIFAVSAFSVSTYTLPLDVFGGARAAFAVSMLVASYGAIQLVISPLFGAIIDRHGYGPVTAIAAVTPLAACAALWSSGAVA